MLRKLTKLTPIFGIVLLLACNNDSKSKPNNNIEIGKEIYIRKCLSCHSHKEYNTLYKPSLNEMSKQSDSLFSKRFARIKIDTLHPSYLQDIVHKAKIEELIKYIRSYKEQKIIPDANSDQKER